MDTHISATEFSRNLSSILGRVQYAHESFVIERHGKVVGRLLPPEQTPPTSTLADLLEILRTWRTGDASFADDLEAIQRDQDLEDGREWPSS